MDGNQKNFTEETARRKNGVMRLIVAGIGILLELAALLLLFLMGFEKYIGVVMIAFRILAVFLVLGIYSQDKTASIKMPWIILILAIPFLGVMLYIFIGLSGGPKKMRKRCEEVDDWLFPKLVQDEAVVQELEEKEPSCAGISRYLRKESRYPIYKNTAVRYYSDAAEALEAQKEALRAAKKFIFMEYFAIEDGDSWRSLEEILVERAAAGVEVRVFYDDVGSIGFVNMDFAEHLRQKGIRCRVFNPMMPILNLFLDHRDHRKMTIVDGEVGFTGGYNLANEYFNINSPFGHWKDTGLRLEGEAVHAMTTTFLAMWNTMWEEVREDNDVDKFLPKPAETITGDGFVQFYADTPIDAKPVGEDVYMSMISRAQKYLYLMTPYLIITDEMSRELGLAARRGVDVRIITPGIPDKKLVYHLTRSYYNRLVQNGVRIFEYTPGFCHAKMSVSDDVIATNGTINLDYRSLYHHFECGCVLTEGEAVQAIRRDFEETFPKCEEVTEKHSSGRSAFLRLEQLVLRLFAPLL